MVAPIALALLVLLSTVKACLLQWQYAVAGRLRGVAKIIHNTLSRNRFDYLGHYLCPHVPIFL